MDPIEEGQKEGVCMMGVSLCSRDGVGKEGVPHQGQELGDPGPPAHGRGRPGAGEDLQTPSRGVSAQPAPSRQEARGTTQGQAQRPPRYVDLGFSPALRPDAWIFL